MRSFRHTFFRVAVTFGTTEQHTHADAFFKIPLSFFSQAEEVLRDFSKTGFPFRADAILIEVFPTSIKSVFMFEAAKHYQFGYVLEILFLKRQEFFHFFFGEAFSRRQAKS